MSHMYLFMCTTPLKTLHKILVHRHLDYRLRLRLELYFYGVLLEVKNIQTLEHFKVWTF